jgi:hypothetical protein
MEVNAPDCNTNFLSTYFTKYSSIILEDKIPQSRMLQTPSSSLSINNVNFDLTSSILSIKFSYDRTIDLSTKNIRFIASSSVENNVMKYFYSSPSV